MFTAMAGKESRALALIAWCVRLHPEDRGWQQNCIPPALLGLADEAKVMVVARAAATAAGYRFPGFFGSDCDWTPRAMPWCQPCDRPATHAHAVRGYKNVLLPAWSADWNASFKLHAPKNTTIEYRVEKGAIVDLKVTPNCRRKEIILPAGK